jgi:ketosteroid isomerase-like protein
MEPDQKRRGFLSKMALGFTLPLLGSAAAAAARAPGKVAPVRDDIDFATWNRINNIVHAYADSIDRFDLDGLAAIFMPDGVYDYKPGMVMQGREAIKVAGAKMLGNYLRTWHNMSSPTVTRGQQPGTFDAMTYFVARHNRKDGGFHALYGRYIDHYVPDPATGELLIANRKVLAQMAEGEVGERYWLPRPS